MATLTRQAPRSLDYVPARELMATLRRLSGFLIVGALFGGLLGGVAALLEPVSFASSVRIWVKDAPRTLDPGFADRQRVLSVDTEAQRILSTPVLSAAGLADAAAVTVSAVPNSAVLDVRVVSGDPVEAHDRAASLAAAYLEARQGFLARRRDESDNAIRAQLSRLGAGLRDSRATKSADRWREAMAGLLKTQAGLRAATVRPGRILRAASQPDRVRADRIVQVMSGAVLGGFMGCALGYAYMSYRREDP